MPKAQPARLPTDARHGSSTSSDRVTDLATGMIRKRSRGVNTDCRSINAPAARAGGRARSAGRFGAARRALAFRLPAGLATGLGDREFLELVPAPEQRAQPARRCTAARPGFGSVVWIAILRRDLAAFELAAARLRSALRAVGKAQPFDRRELLLQLTPRRRGFVRNHPNDAVAQRDQIIERHC